ncbi:hypothetical protein R5W24_002768 [Gemmata sp. JC717]|uniref:hypothetical protein n=1 Tax=Gemmata algarum TaxID=2975278 RepID=UPI0021BA8D87|nr:hypothetical protein [Gemmata algarum]MDY3553663.1 hypothetical protein [Gemmata algarum]
MKLLTSVFTLNGRVLPAGTWFTVAVCAFVIGLEIAGRYAASDLHDGAAALALVGCGLAVAVRHRREPLPWVARLATFGRRAAASASWLRYEHGIDLRGVPPLPRRTPPVVFMLVAVLLTWGGCAAGAWAAFPAGWRVIGTHSSYTLYLALLLVLWGTLLTVACVGLFVPIAVLDKWLRRWLGDTDRRGAELAAVVGYAVLVALVAWEVPPAPVLFLCLVVATGAWAAYVPRGRDGAALLWRGSADKPVCAVPLRRVLAAVIGLTALLAFAVLLTACGGRLFAPPRADDTMPFTALLGTVAAWFLPGLLCVVLVKLNGARRGDPARRTPPTLHIAGSNAVDVRAAARIARRWGWAVCAAPHAREPNHVGVEVVVEERSEATEFNPVWPLKVSLADLQLRAVKERLDRRDEIKVRRQLFRGLQKLFKRASVFKGPAGGGFWLAPHWWFVEGVGREDADSASEEAPPMVGPAYSRVLPRRARQHAHAVLRATQVDMIFIEDGVTFRNLERALRVLTELYDVHGGTRRAEEMHFRGVPKVRAMIHEYEPGNPFRSDLYPEPKFDDLSRVRVLHIFRDRGASEELTDQPFDFSWTPAPAPVGSAGW